MNPLLPGLALLLNALVWGLSWWPFRQLQAHGLHPLWSTTLVYVFSLACLLLFRPAAWRSLGAHPSLWWLMLASGLTNVGFNWAVTVGDVVRVVLLFYLMPAWSVLLAWPLLGQRPTAGALTRLVLALGGVFVVLQTPGAGWPVPESLADWLALMGGFCFALTNLLLLKLNTVPSESRIFAMFSGGTLMAGLAAFVGMQQGFVGPAPSPTTALLVLGSGLSLAFLVGNMALQYGAARLAAHTTALIMLSEVVFASASSVALGASQWTMRTLVGGTLIVMAALWSAWPQRASVPAMHGSP